MKRIKRKKFQKRIRRIYSKSYHKLSRKDYEFLHEVFCCERRRKKQKSRHRKMNWLSFLKPKRLMKNLVEIVSKIVV
ncbi:MAG: hypothetical protein JWQ09_974 [Segetibacter sp.]|nr:hypothetical protein [Segetibacter sp.]